jgi:hypothetical protein
MGVRRLFSRGGEKISRGWGKEPTFCLKNNEKDTIFPNKSLKIYYFWPARGDKSPSCRPLRTPMRTGRHFWDVGVIKIEIAKLEVSKFEITKFKIMFKPFPK